MLSTADGTPKVTDFGLARRLDGGSGLTQTGSRWVRRATWPPSRPGEKAAVGPAADVYALGAILYEMLTGPAAVPGGDVTETLQQVIHEDPVPPSRFNAGCRATWNDLPEVPIQGSAAALRQCRGAGGRPPPLPSGEADRARPAGPLERLARWGRRSPAAAALLAVTLLAATTLAVRGVAGGRVASFAPRGRWKRTCGRRTGCSGSRLPRGGSHKSRPSLGSATAGRSGYTRLWRRPAAIISSWSGSRRSALNRWTLVEGHHIHAALLRFNKARADRDYAEAFRDHGLGEPPNDPQGVAARIRASTWAAHWSPRWTTGRAAQSTRPGRIDCLNCASV